MNILETQVTDLEYLAESPIALSSTSPFAMSGQHQHQHQSALSTTESPADTGSASGKKRKVDDDGSQSVNASSSVNGNTATQTRAKRNRYISIACNECKRRKIKCNGNSPCQRCGNLNLECQYAPNCCSNGFKDSEEFKSLNAQVLSLQDQIDNLYTSLNALRSGEGSGALQPQSERSLSVSQTPIQPTTPAPRYRPMQKHAPFRGPTSSSFSLDVAKNTLQKMGYPHLVEGDEGFSTENATPLASPNMRSLPPPLDTNHGNPTRDPILSLGKEEMIRLCRVYEEEMGLMYPVVNIEHLIIHGTNLYEFIDAALRTGLVKPTGHGSGIKDEQSCMLKTVLACAAVTEGSGNSEIGSRLFESVKESADHILHSERIEVKSLPFLVLVAMYHFHCDEEALAWRIIGQVARMCIELGLHRRDTLFKNVTDEEERSNAIKVFWSVYVLDRRWSFGTGMPFAIQDADIDPSLPEPVVTIPYLNVMISYSRIGSKVWKSICSFSPAFSPSLNVEEIGYLDYQILQWQKSIPSELLLPTSSQPQTSSRAMHRLQILLYLRNNQMRILIYRPVLLSASSIQENLTCANTVVDLAKDTIRALTHLNQTSDIYRAQQVCFNYFLISALAVLFLASCHAPVHFSSVCRDEFYMALDLVKGFSNKSWVSKRLWRTIKGLKEVGPKLGLAPDLKLSSSDNHHDAAGSAGEDAHSSAALAMAGLAGHEISSLSSHFTNPNAAHPHAQALSHDALQQARNGNSGSPVDGFQMSHEMTTLFEMALQGINGGGGSSGPGYMGLDGGRDDGGLGSNAFGGEEELYRHMRDLF
ncbi:fungal specific transcription factor domain-containing protein [Phlyctema vagabunda]|uniref:Fungal specific transcription factor domain-containing protein n=1 Tax=Phlyctema vagabunda TaxID=108571 RepID=A0ABR4PBE4_9HELO